MSAATGESKRYLELFHRYQEAAGVTRDRLFLELAEEALPRVKLYIVATDEKGKPVRLKLVSGVMPTRPRLD